MTQVQFLAWELSYAVGMTSAPPQKKVTERPSNLFSGCQISIFEYSIKKFGVPVMAQQLTNLTSIDEDTG